MLRNWLMQPLQDIKKINERLDIVQGLNSRFSFNVELRNSFLSKIDDIQTINMKLSRYKNKMDKGIEDTSKVRLEDCAKLQRTIASCKDLYAYMKLFDGDNKEFFNERFTLNLGKYLGYLGKLEELIYKTVYYDESNKEYIINPAVNDRLSDLKNIIDKNYKKIIEIRDEVEEEINNNSSKNKKVKVDEYINSGYILEVSKKEGDEFIQQNKKKYRLVSSNKRTVIITSKDLQLLSDEIKENRTKFRKLQNDWVRKIIDVVCTYQPVLENLTTLIGTLDILSSFAILIFNSKYSFCRPIIGQPKTKLYLENSRHLLLEYLNNNKDEIEVVSNDLTMTPGIDDFHLLTGINMGGKSTYLRQIGICSILAHIGCYVPATKAEIPLIDQIFTRVGAGDMMLKGVSTYMNEMIEVCSLLKSATEYSLLLIDELGRGTSTKDGVAISAGIIQYICRVKRVVKEDDVVCVLFDAAAVFQIFESRHLRPCSAREALHLREGDDRDFEVGGDVFQRLADVADAEPVFLESLRRLHELQVVHHQQVDLSAIVLALYLRPQVFDRAHREQEADRKVRRDAHAVHQPLPVLVFQLRPPDLRAVHAARVGEDALPVLDVRHLPAHDADLVALLRRCQCHIHSEYALADRRSCAYDRQLSAEKSADHMVKIPDAARDAGNLSL